MPKWLDKVLQIVIPTGVSAIEQSTQDKKDWGKVVITAILSGLPFDASSGLDVADVNTYFRMIGQCFGPKGVQHSSELSQEDRDEILSLVPYLNSNHGDYAGPLKGIPRICTTFFLRRDLPWPMIFGNASSEQPLPAPGQYFGKEGFVTGTAKNGLHMHFGFREDDAGDALKSTKYRVLQFPSFKVQMYE